MDGDELLLIQTISTATTMMKASATTSTHRARSRERLAGRTGVKLPSDGIAARLDDPD